MTDDSPTFSELGLPDQLVAGLTAQGITVPSPIQREVIPLALAGGDIQAQARTGSGKTLAFLLPLAARAAARACSRAWVVCPTRELAQQVAREGEHLFGHGQVVTVVGGASVGQQIRDIKRGPLLIAGTPGRMVDLLGQGQLPADAEVLVLDEADQMLDMGFKDEIDHLVKDLGPGVERWCFSATYPPAIQRATERWLEAPRQVRLDVDQGSNHVPQRFVVARPRGEVEALTRLLQATAPDRALVFVRTREEVDRIAQAIALEGIEAGGISGDLSQEARERVLSRFRKGQVAILVATDVAARGLDVPGVTHVFNYGLPVNGAAYTHRVGRTGRAGADGEAWSIISARERGKFFRIVRDAGCRADERDLPTAAAIVDARRDRLAAQIAERLSKELPLPGNFRPMIDEHGAEAVLSALVHRLVPDALPEPKVPERSERSEHGEADGAVVELDIGKDDGVTAAAVVAMVCRGAGITNRELGRFKMFGRTTLLACSPAIAKQILNGEIHYRGHRVPVKLDTSGRGLPPPPKGAGARGGPYKGKPKRDPRSGHSGRRPRA